MRTDFIVVLVTCSSKREAEKISDSLLKKKLIACANIIYGIESKFWWKGRIDKANETLAILKTRRKNFKMVEKEVGRIHSYEAPEIIAIPIAAGNKIYLDWLNGELCR